MTENDKRDAVAVLANYIDQRALKVASAFTSTGRHRAALQVAIISAIKDGVNRVLPEDQRLP